MLTFTDDNRALLAARAAEAAGLLRTLGNETRLMILCQLGPEELSVGALQQRLGVSQSALSQHLALLREDGVVSTRRQSQTIFYRIADPRAVALIETLAQLFCPELSRDDPHPNKD